MQEGGGDPIGRLMPRQIDNFEVERAMRKQLSVSVFVFFSFVFSAVSAETFFCAGTHSAGIDFDERKKEWKESSFSSDLKFVIRTTKPSDRELQFEPKSRSISEPFVMYQVGDLEDMKTGCQPYGWKQLLLCDSNVAQTLFSKNTLRFEHYSRFGFILENEPWGDRTYAGDVAVTVGRCTKID